MAADYSFFRSSLSFTVCTPYCIANGRGLLKLLLLNVFHGLLFLFLYGWLLILPLINYFPEALHVILLCGWHWNARSSALQQLY